jgi:hypothetical protein
VSSVSNREVSDLAGVNDQGQISKMMIARLEEHGLVQNTGGHGRGAPKAWRLTPQGEEVLHAKHNNQGVKVRPREQDAKMSVPTSKTGLFAVLCGLLGVKGSGAPKIGVGLVLPGLAALMGALALPTTAGAYATVEPRPIFSGAPGLPDG